MMTCSTVLAGGKIFVDTTVSNSDYYPWITKMEIGPIDWVYESEDVAGRAYRVVVTTSEIYNSMYFEEITIGDEGCCVKVSSTRMFEIEQFAKKAGLKGELASLRFVEWLSPTSFKFKFHNRSFILRNVEKKIVSVMESNS
jgi:hypothetical protein